LKEFIEKDEYDSDAFIQDIEDVIIDNMEIIVAMNKNISNIYNICNDDKYISHCKDFLRYYKCMFTFIFSIIPIMTQCRSLIEQILSISYVICNWFYFWIFAIMEKWYS